NLAGTQLDEGARGRDLSPVLAAKAEPERERLGATEVDLDSITDHAAPIESVQDEIHFTSDDHQAATALQDVSGQPNRIRAIRTARGKCAFYCDPEGKRPPEYEMYDLDRDPTESRNLVDRNTGEPLDASDDALRAELGERLERLMSANGTAPRRSTQLGS